MNRQQLITTVIGSTILGAAVVLAAWPEGNEATASRSTGPRPVQVATVISTSIDRSVRLPGVTRAADRATLSFAVPARLASRPVEVGDSVATGQVLATLDDHEYRLAERAAAAALTELEVRLAQARRDEQRVESLAAARAATAEEVEQIQAGTAALEAAHDAAAVRLDDTRRLLQESKLKAPFAGTITSVRLEPGEWASPGLPVVELSGSGVVEVVVEAPETVRSRVREGQEVQVELSFLDRIAMGNVTAVASAAGGAGRLFPVTVTLEPTPGLVDGLSAEVVLSLITESRLTVPLSAVLNPGSSRPAVFRIGDGHAERVEVELGHLVGDRIGIHGALTEGDQVAVAGHTALADDDAVEVF